MDKSATIPALDGEIWLPVPRFSLYQASNHGRVWSSYGNGRFLKPQLRGTPGYPKFSVTLCDGTGEKWQVSVHQLVMLLFVGPCPEGQEVRHLDGNPFNNRWEPGDEAQARAAGGNLYYGSHAENGADMAAHGSARDGAHRGSGHYRAKLTEELVPGIRAEYAAGGVTEQVLADRHGVNVSTMHRLLVRKTWTHVA